MASVDSENNTEQDDHDRGDPVTTDEDVSKEQCFKGCSE
jgi:hypothetical protein